MKLCNYQRNAINGSETDQGNKEVKALSNFYKAFNTRDIQLMEQSWWNTEEISMDNPIGGIRRDGVKYRKGITEYLTEMQKSLSSFTISQLTKRITCFLQQEGKEATLKSMK